MLLVRRGTRRSHVPRALVCRPLADRGRAEPGRVVSVRSRESELFGNRARTSRMGRRRTSSASARDDSGRAAVAQRACSTGDCNTTRCSVGVDGDAGRVLCGQ